MRSMLALGHYLGYLTEDITMKACIMKICFIDTCSYLALRSIYG